MRNFLFFGKFVGRELREIYCSGGLFFEAARCRACASRTAGDPWARHRRRS